MYQRVNEIVNGKRGITPGTALRLARFFGMTPDFWMNLQLRWELYHAQAAEQLHIHTSIVIVQSAATATGASASPLTRVPSSMMTTPKIASTASAPRSESSSAIPPMSGGPSRNPV